MATFSGGKVVDQFIVRFERPGHRDEIKSRAAANNRSMNAELLYLIEFATKTIDAVRPSQIDAAALAIRREISDALAKKSFIESMQKGVAA
jgi:hypothetical protein